MQSAQSLDPAARDGILAFLSTLFDQREARIVVEPERPAPGYWFGGGEMARGPGGELYLSGRYRNAGDSRTGLDLGDRGKELAIFRSRDRGASWEKLVSLSKRALVADGREVLSIEGSALRAGRDGAELFVSSEKRIPYPDEVSDYMKPGTGVWTIERLAAPDVEGLGSAAPHTVLESRDPARLHLKDPFLFAAPDGSSCLGFCHHPFGWSSTNSAYAPLAGGGELGPPDYDFLPRGPTWDVAIARATCLFWLPLPGPVARRVGILLYDGGECLRSHAEHAAARNRPRGYSCEELGGAACFVGDTLSSPIRLSPHFPLFTSPWGTGSSRYAKVLRADGGFYATWQQSRPDGSQALVMRFLAEAEAEELLQE